MTRGFVWGAAYRGVLVAVIGMWSVSAKADILFLDLNNNMKEIEAAQKAASARGEKLIVRPLVPQELRKKLQAAVANQSRLSRQYFQANCNRRSSEQCRNIDAESNSVAREYSKLRSEVQKVDGKVLKEELAKLKASNAKISSLIVSGHDGNGYFGGTQGDLSDREISDAFKENGPIGDSVRSVLLWGCYTTNLGALEFHWKGLFPNANMIAGYDGSAPLSDKPANWAYLEDVLKKEKKLTEAKDRKELSQIFKTISGANQVHASICLRNDEVVTLEKVLSIKEEMSKCKDPGAEELQKKFYCYSKAEPGCEDVPKETGSGPIREYYNHLQATLHCSEILAMNGFERPSTDEVLRLIFDRQVRENFGRIHAKEIEAFNQSLKKLGLPDQLQLSDLSRLTRKQHIDKLKGITSALNERKKGVEDAMGKVDDVELLTAEMLFESLNEAVSKAQCVPFQWVEPNAVRPSPCVVQDLANRARDKAESRAMGVRFSRAEEEILARHPSAGEFRRVRDRKNELYNRLMEEQGDIPLDQLADSARQGALEQRAPSRITVLRRLDREYSTLKEEVDRLESERRREMAPQVIQHYERELQSALSSKTSAKIIEEIQFRIELWRKWGADRNNVRVNRVNVSDEDDSISEPPTPDENVEVEDTGPGDFVNANEGTIVIEPEGGQRPRRTPRGR